MAGRVLVFIVGLFACALIFAPASTALGPLFTVKVAKQKDGSYGSETKVNLDKNETVTLWFRMKNVSPGQLSNSGFDDGDNKIPEDLSVKWFKGQTNVSHDVQTSGLDFEFKEDQVRYYQAKIRAEGNNVKHCVTGRGNYGDAIYKSARGDINNNCPT